MQTKPQPPTPHPAAQNAPKPPTKPPGDIAKPNAPHKPLPADAGELAVSRLDALRNANGGLRTAEIRRDMQKARALVWGWLVWGCLSAGAGVVIRAHPQLK